MDPNTIATVMVAGVGGLGTAVYAVGTWGYNLQQRVNKHDTLFEEREKQAQERHSDLKEDLKEIKERLGVRSK